MNFMESKVLKEVVLKAIDTMSVQEMDQVIHYIDSIKDSGDEANLENRTRQNAMMQIRNALQQGQNGQWMELLSV